MSKKSGIVILGIFAADTAYKAKRLPHIAETLMGSGFTLGPGGKGSNQAIAAAKAGGKVTFISRVGNDPFGEMALAAYAAAGVKANVMKMDGVSSGAAFIFVDEVSGDNAIIVVPGAAGLIGIEDVDANRAAIESAQIFMTQLEQPLEAALHGLSMAKRAGVTTVFNPAPARAIPDEIYGLCDFIVPNEVEAAELVGHGGRSGTDGTTRPHGLAASRRPPQAFRPHAALLAASPRCRPHGRSSRPSAGTTRWPVSRPNAEPSSSRSRNWPCGI